MNQEKQTSSKAGRTSNSESSRAQAQTSAQQSAQWNRPSMEQISARAYARWQQAGGAHGNDQDHWFAAEREVDRGSDTTSRSDEAPSEEPKL